MEKPRLFVKVAGKEYGPYDADEIKALIRENRFGPDDFVRREGETAWFRAGNIASLKAMFEPASAPTALRCPACGAALEADAAFCTECGRKTPGVSAPAAPAIRCSRCGTPATAEDAFCGECGARLTAEPPVETEPTPAHTPPPPPPITTKPPPPPPTEVTPTPPPPPAVSTPVSEGAEPTSSKRRGAIIAAAIGGGLILLIVLAVAAFFITDYLGVNPLTQEEEAAPAAPVVVKPPGGGTEVRATLVSAAGGGRSSTSMTSKLAYHDDNVCKILKAEGPGGLTLDLTVTSNGAVMKASVVSSTYGSAVNKRVENAARRWNFGAGTGVAKLKVKYRAAPGKS